MPTKTSQKNSKASSSAVEKSHNKSKTELENKKETKEVKKKTIKKKTTTKESSKTGNAKKKVEKETKKETVKKKDSPKKKTTTKESNKTVNTRKKVEKETKKETVKKKNTPKKKISTKKAESKQKNITSKKNDNTKIENVKKESKNEISKIKNTATNFFIHCKKTYKSLNTKRNNLILTRFIIISLFLLLTLQLSNSIYHIVVWKKENKEIEEQVEEIEKEVVVEEIEENPEKTEVIKPVEEPKKEDPYWDYIKMKLINVDFKDLKKKNNHTVGWIQVNGTNINYPFVQTNNNDFYLNHAFDKSYNTAGWVFLDYRNNIKSFDKNTIIYAHGRLDNTMFGSLRYILKNEWIKNSDNYIIKLSTEYENTLWQVFSIYRIPTTSDYLQIEFKDGKAFTKFTDKLIKRSQYNFKTKVGEKDKIITLSTCFDDHEKLVLHAKLIKREAR